MKKVSVFQTEDGRLFETENEAKEHEVFLSKNAVVDDFLNSDFNPYTSISQRSIVRQAIIKWELWKKENAK